MAKTWLITGASRGFGRQLAEAVLDAGDQLVATARQPEQLDDLVAAHGERVQAVALDVTDAAAAEALAKWKFTPALRDEAPVEVDAVFEVPFHLAPRTAR